MERTFPVLNPEPSFHRSVNRSAEAESGTIVPFYGMIVPLLNPCKYQGEVRFQAIGTERWNEVSYFF